MRSATASAACGEARASALEAEGVRAAFVEVDATDPHSLETARQAAEERLGPVNVLVNAPGVNSSTPFLEIGLDEWHRVIDPGPIPSLLPKSSH